MLFKVDITEYNMQYDKSNDESNNFTMLEVSNDSELINEFKLKSPLYHVNIEPFFFEAR